jgi:hypothetical protein
MGDVGDVSDVGSSEFQRLAGDALGLPLDPRRGGSTVHC